MNTPVESVIVVWLNVAFLVPLINTVAPLKGVLAFLSSSVPVMVGACAITQAEIIKQ